MAFVVEPGQRFFVQYTSDGVQEEYPVPDVTATTDDVSCALNGIVQPPYEVYTVHQGNLRFVDGPPVSGFIVTIRS